ncbi:MAG: AbrB/MazE/SpoVT family DNA-binding domain-containing protein [Acidobacteriota bacterium]
MGYRVSSQGQVTIPQKLRERLGIRGGDEVDFVEEGGRVYLKPERERANPFEAYIGIAPGLKTVHEIDAWVRELREDDRVPE